jgi:cell fate regulator YaaT (PSP1 superfamily)
MPSTVEVRFKGIRKGYYRWRDQEDTLRLRDPVIVEVDRGFDFGHITSLGDLAEKKCGGCSGCGTEEPATATKGLKAIVRRASEADILQAGDLRKGEDDIRRRVAERARRHELDLKISDAEWQWDRKKLTVYFTAEQRVDFRALVRELAAQYHTRIELRQIGVRDEAARLGGVGRCGREYCCSTWLDELNPVSLSLAKDQRLSLNPTQISGGCGRLLCCLRYEHDFYVTQRKRFPKEGKTVHGTRGPEKVTAVDIFRERVFLRSDEHGPRTLLLAEFTSELEAAGTEPVGHLAPPHPPSEPSRSLKKTKPAQENKPGPAAPAPEISAAPEPPPPPPSEPKRRRRRKRRSRRPPPPTTPPTPNDESASPPSGED